MQFNIDKKVLDLGVKVVGIIITGVENKNKSIDFEQFKESEIKRLIEKYNDINLKDSSIINGYYELHEKVNVPRRKNIPASENLINHLLKSNNLFSINKVVDIYNILSIDSQLAIGAHDIKNIDGNINLKFTIGNEIFIPLGQEDRKEVKNGEYSYIDDNSEIICRLEIRQVNKTKITEETCDIFYLIQGNMYTSEESLIKTASDLIDITTKYCGGTGEILKGVII